MLTFLRRLQTPINDLLGNSDNSGEQRNRDRSWQHEDALFCSFDTFHGEYFAARVADELATSDICLAELRSLLNTHVGVQEA